MRAFAELAGAEEQRAWYVPGSIENIDHVAESLSEAELVVFSACFQHPQAGLQHDLQQLCRRIGAADQRHHQTLLFVEPEDKADFLSQLAAELGSLGWTIEQGTDSDFPQSFRNSNPLELLSKLRQEYDTFPTQGYWPRRADHFLVANPTPTWATGPA